MSLQYYRALMGAQLTNPFPDLSGLIVYLDPSDQSNLVLTGSSIDEMTNLAPGAVRWDATSSGSARPTSTQIDGVYMADYDGTDDYMSFGNTGGIVSPGANDLYFRETDSYTIAFVFKGVGSSASFGSPLLGRNNSDVYYNMNIDTDSGTGRFIHWRYLSFWRSNINSGTTDVGDDNVHLIVLTQDGTAKTADLWVDGVELLSGESTDVDSNYPFLIDNIFWGYNQGDAGGTFTNGAHGEIAITDEYTSDGSVITGLWDYVSAKYPSA